MPQETGHVRKLVARVWIAGDVDVSGGAVEEAIRMGDQSKAFAKRDVAGYEIGDLREHHRDERKRDDVLKGHLPRSELKDRCVSLGVLSYGE